MKESLNFYYDGVYSIDMKIKNVNSSSGLFEEFFLPTRVIHEQYAANRDKPYFLRMSDEPLSFSLRLALEEDFTQEDYRKLAKWLYQDYYKPLVFESDPNRIFYAIIEGNSTYTHNGLYQGYIDVNVRCDSPFAYTPEYIDENIHFRDEDKEQIFIIDGSNFNTTDLHKIKIVGDTVELDQITRWGQLADSETKWGDIF